MRRSLVNALAVIAAFVSYSSASFAGKQKSSLMKDVAIYTTNVASTSRVTIKGITIDLQKIVSYNAGQIYYRGVTPAGNSCSKWSCSFTNFSVVDRSLRAELHADTDQDGNNEEIVRDVNLGEVNEGGEALLDVKWSLTAMFVRDRYSFIEKLMGARDADFINVVLESK